jgi:hypothetical protein
MNAHRLWPVTALPLLLFWLFSSTNTSDLMTYKSLAACVAEGKKQVEKGDARKAVCEKEDEDAALKRKGQPSLGTSEDCEVGWECKPSDGSASTYGGHWKAKAHRPTYNGGFMLIVSHPQLTAPPNQRYWRRHLAR